jgi:hypothetical protein
VIPRATGEQDYAARRDTAQRVTNGATGGSAQAEELVARCERSVKSGQYRLLQQIGVNGVRPGTQKLQDRDGFSYTAT